MSAQRDAVGTRSGDDERLLSAVRSRRTALVTGGMRSERERLARRLAAALSGLQVRVVPSAGAARALLGSPEPPSNAVDAAADLPGALSWARARVAERLPVTIVTPAALATERCFVKTLSEFSDGLLVVDAGERLSRGDPSFDPAYLARVLTTSAHWTSGPLVLAEMMAPVATSAFHLQWPGSEALELGLPRGQAVLRVLAVGGDRLRALREAVATEPALVFVRSAAEIAELCATLRLSGLDPVAILPDASHRDDTRARQLSLFVSCYDAWAPALPDARHVVLYSLPASVEELARAVAPSTGNSWRRATVLFDPSEVPALERQVLGPTALEIKTMVAEALSRSGSLWPRATAEAVLGGAAASLIAGYLELAGYVRLAQPGEVYRATLAFEAHTIAGRYPHPKVRPFVDRLLGELERRAAEPLTAELLETATGAPGDRVRRALELLAARGEILLDRTLPAGGLVVLDAADREVAAGKLSARVAETARTALRKVDEVVTLLTSDRCAWHALAEYFRSTSPTCAAACPACSGALPDVGPSTTALPPPDDLICAVREEHPELATRRMLVGFLAGAPTTLLRRAGLESHSLFGCMKTHRLRDVAAAAARVPRRTGETSEATRTANSTH